MNAICPTCNQECSAINIKDGKCWDCQLLETGKFTRCPKCGGMARKPYKLCLSCFTGFRKATIAVNEDHEAVESVAEASPKVAPAQNPTATI
jgi:hypothetical protein